MAHRLPYVQPDILMYILLSLTEVYKKNEDLHYYILLLNAENLFL